VEMVEFLDMADVPRVQPERGDQAAAFCSATSSRVFLRGGSRPLRISENSKANRIETMTIGIEAIPCFSEWQRPQTRVCGRAGAASMTDSQPVLYSARVRLGDPLIAWSICSQRAGA
jgi:hypothetical protein